MPSFRFFLVKGNNREWVASMDLQDEDEVVPLGLKVTTQILAIIVQDHPEEEDLIIEAVNEADRVIYKFTVSKRPKDENALPDYLH